jgi:hypothetical protein
MQSVNERYGNVEPSLINPQDIPPQTYEQDGQVYEEQHRLQGGGTPYYQPMIMPSEKADLYDKIRPEDIVETIRYLLMGYEYDKQMQIWKFNPAYKNVAVTELGAWQLSTLLLPVSNKNVSISKLKDDEIRLMTKIIVRTAMKMCLRNWKDYGIRSPDQYFFIKDIMLSIAFITLKQPEDAGVRTFIQGVTQESRIVQEQPKREGALGAIFRR